MFSAFSLHVKRCIWPQCKDHSTARIILSEKKDDPGTRMILPNLNGLRRPSLPTHHPETGDGPEDEF